MGRWDKVIAARRENVLTALRAIREQKLRSFLTCLGIIIGVATVIVMVSLIQGFNQTFIAPVPELRCHPRAVPEARGPFRRRRAPPRGGAPAPDPDPRRRRGDPAVRAGDRLRLARALAIATTWTSATAANRTNNATIGGVTHSYPDANNHFVAARPLLHRRGGAALGAGRGDRDRHRRGALPAHRPARAGRSRSTGGRSASSASFEKKGGFLDPAPTSRSRSRSGSSTASGRT